MKNVKKSSKGVTLIALVTTIAVMIIIASITIYEGKELIQQAELEELRTNMPLIQAKSMEYVEQANFQMGINPSEKTEEQKEQIREEVYGKALSEGAQLKKATNDIPPELGITDTSTCYWLTLEAQKIWGLEKIKLENNEEYLIKFNEKEETVEVYNTKGYKGKYSLTEINNL